MTANFPGKTKTHRRLAAEECVDHRAASLMTQHRVKNLLANIRALAAQTYRNSDTLDEFYEGLEGRLQALALVQAVLGLREDGMVNLTDLILEQILSDAAGHPDVFSVEGPDLLMDLDAAQPFAMVVHELITNAIKYGALSSEDGRITVRWQIEERKSQPYFEFNWQEKGDGIAPDADTSGFGRRMIEEALPHQLGGEAVLSFPPDGCHCHISIPMDHRIRPGEQVEDD